MYSNVGIKISLIPIDTTVRRHELPPHRVSLVSQATWDQSLALNASGLRTSQDSKAQCALVGYAHDGSADLICYPSGMSTQGSGGLHVFDEIITIKQPTM